MKKPTIEQILPLLEKQYGTVEFAPHHDPISELILTILSQNTSDLNSRPAFQSLKSTFKTWDEIMIAGPSEIAEVIKSGGLGQIKALRIQQSLQAIKDRRGNLELDFLDDLPVPQAVDWLKGLPGVGNKTANCVLLFALGKPALPVDTHIFRVSQRLHLIKEKDSLDDAHQVLGKLVPPENMYQFHVLMIEHGRKTCSASRPHCSECILKPICPSSNKLASRRK